MSPLRIKKAFNFFSDLVENKSMSARKNRRIKKILTEDIDRSFSTKLDS